jgi:hypothetical protein
MFLSIAALLLVTFGSMLIGHNLKNQCVALLKDKPAIEIQAVCK